MSDPMIVAVIGAAAVVTSGITAAVLGFFGVRYAARTSADANARLASVSERNNAALIRSSTASKIAEMRVDWNDDLRTSFAKFSAACASAVAGLSFGSTAEDADKQYWYAYMALKLNSKDHSHREVMKIANQMMTFVNGLLKERKQGRDIESEKKLEDFTRLFSDFYEKASIILKTEWDRAKSEVREGLTSPQ